MPSNEQPAAQGQEPFDVPPRPTTDAEIEALPVLDLDEFAEARSAATPEGDTIRTALQGAMVGEWGRDNALAALASLKRQNEQLRAEVQRLNKVIAYGVTR